MTHPISDKRNQSQAELPLPLSKKLRRETLAKNPFLPTHIICEHIFQPSLDTTTPIRFCDSISNWAQVSSSFHQYATRYWNLASSHLEQITPYPQWFSRIFLIRKQIFSLNQQRQDSRLQGWEYRRNIVWHPLQESLAALVLWRDLNVIDEFWICEALDKIEDSSDRSFFFNRCIRDYGDYFFVNLSIPSIPEDYPTSILSSLLSTIWLVFQWNQHTGQITEMNDLLLEVETQRQYCALLKKQLLTTRNPSRVRQTIKHVQSHITSSMKEWDFYQTSCKKTEMLFQKTLKTASSIKITHPQYRTITKECLSNLLAYIKHRKDCIRYKKLVKRFF